MQYSATMVILLQTWLKIDKQDVFLPKTPKQRRSWTALEALLNATAVECDPSSDVLEMSTTVVLARKVVYYSKFYSFAKPTVQLFIFARASDEITRTSGPTHAFLFKTTSNMFLYKLIRTGVQERSQLNGPHTEPKSMRPSPNVNV